MAQVDDEERYAKLLDRTVDDLFTHLGDARVHTISTLPGRGRSTRLKRRLDQDLPGRWFLAGDMFWLHGAATPGVIAGLDNYDAILFDEQRWNDLQPTGLLTQTLRGEIIRDVRAMYQLPRDIVLNPDLKIIISTSETLTSRFDDMMLETLRDSGHRHLTYAV